MVLSCVQRHYLFELPTYSVISIPDLRTNPPEAVEAQVLRVKERTRTGADEILNWLLKVALAAIDSLHQGCQIS